MTDTTTTRPPPTSLAVLRQYWLPVEPGDTDVTRWRAAVAAIDELTAGAVADIAALDEQDRFRLDRLLEAARR
jgi:hypothetical protein